MNTKNILLVALWALCMSPLFLPLLEAQSATSPPIQLSDVLASVEEQYPLILQTQQDLEKSQGDLLAAQGGFDPALKANSHFVPVGYYQHNYYDISLEQPTALWGTRIYAGWRLGEGKFPYYDGKMATFDNGEIRVGLETPLLRNGSIDERRKKILSAENGIELAQTSVSLSRLEITRQASYKYWDWLAAGKKLAISENLLAIARERDKGILHRYQKGDAPQFEHRENERVLIQRESYLLAAQRAFQKAVLELSLYYRDSHGNPVLLKREQLPANFPKPIQRPELSESNNQFEISEMATRHPDVARLRLQMDQNQIDLRYSKNLFLPRLDFQIGYSVDLGAVPLPQSPSSYSLQPQAQYPNELKLGLTFEFPLFQRAAQGQTRAIQATLIRMEEQAQLTRNRIETTILDALQAMETARKRSLLAQQELTISRTLEEGEKTRLLHGDSQLFIVNLREQSTGEAAIKEVDAMAEYFRAQADYRAATAR